MRHLKLKTSMMFLISFSLYVSIVCKVSAATTDTGENGYNTVTSSTNLGDDNFNNGASEATTSQIDDNETEEATSTASAASTTTSGPRLRDAIRYKFKRGEEALKGVGKKSESEVKGGYNRVKMNAVTKGAKFLVDYEVGLKSYAYIIRNSKKEKWRNADLEVIQNAISASLKPLKTYQQAKGNVHKRKIGQSVKELFRLLRNKPINYTIKEGDWEKGKIHSSVFRRFDIQDLLVNRDNVLSLRPELTDDLLAIENHKLFESREYFMKKEDDNWKLGKLVSNNLDWPGFESRYFDIVTKILVADPRMTREVRHYLAVYLSTGDAQEEKYRSMMDQALTNQAKMATLPTQSTSTTSGSLTTNAATVTVTVRRQPCGISEASRTWQPWLSPLLISIVLSLSILI